MVEDILKEMFIHAMFGKNLISAGLNGVKSLLYHIYIYFKITLQKNNLIWLFFFHLTSVSNEY